MENSNIIKSINTIHHVYVGELLELWLNIWSAAMLMKTNAFSVMYEDILPGTDTLHK